MHTNIHQLNNTVFLVSLKYNQILLLMFDIIFHKCSSKKIVIIHNLHLEQLINKHLGKRFHILLGNSLRQRALTLARAIEVGFNLIVNETYCVRHGLEIRDGKEAGICQEPLHIAIVRN